MRNVLLYCSMLVFITSCATTKWKKTYLNNKIGVLYSKYKIDKNEYSFTTSSSTLSYKPLSKQTRKKVKETVKQYEAVLALVPDSIYKHAGKIDSFYMNTNKINYIRKNHLLSLNKHLL